jgi:hypothetical protein
MRALIIIGMGIIALMTYTAFARASAASAGVGRIGSGAGPNYAGIPATGPARDPLSRTLLYRGHSPAVIRVQVGPMIDMDNRRQDEDIAQRRKRQAELKEQAPNYTYPSGGYILVRPPKGSRSTRPPQGYPYAGPQSGYNLYPGSGFYPYNPNITYYRDPTTGLYYVYPQSIDPGHRYNSRAKG